MLIAGSLLGVVGAILAVPFAAVIKIVLREAGAPRRERMAALRAAEPPISPACSRAATRARRTLSLDRQGLRRQRREERHEDPDTGEHVDVVKILPTSVCGTRSP